MQAQTDKPHELNLAPKPTKRDMLIHIGPTSSMLENPDLGGIAEAGATGSSNRILSDYRSTQGLA